MYQIFKTHKMKVIPYAFFPLDFVLEKKGLDAVLTATEMLQKDYFTEEFTLYDIDVVTRVFNHWAKMGLLPERKNRESGCTYKLNFVEYIWFKIVKELRVYGYPIEKIKLVKQQLLTEISDDSFAHIYAELGKLDKKEIEKHLKKQKLPKQEVEIIINAITEINKQKDKLKNEHICYLHLLIMDCIIKKNDIRILIDSEANVVTFSSNNEDNLRLEELKQEIGFDNNSYISISLIKFFKKFVMNKENIEFISKNLILNDNELFILSLIREGKAKSITIKFENQKPNLIEMENEKKIEIQSRLSEILLKRQYQELIVKTQEGDIAYSNIKTKMKLNN